ncbi:MAG: hypothetical protein Q9186_001680 [Xanthomendoza sp. 1 TL-2023]
MDQWLDSLSEDWVSQPRSPHSVHLRRSSSALSVASNASNASQSRIPRLKPRNSSNLAPSSLTSSKRTSPSPVDPKDRALKERSSSYLNITHDRTSKTAVGPQSPAVGKRVQSKQHGSSKSVPSVPQDTIQHRTSRISPAKEKDLASTPEWKRRVLQGKVGSAGPDLFGPIGLENIFKPPTVGRNSKPVEKQRREKKFQPAVVDEFPSSPPPFPSDLESIERSGGTDRKRSSLSRKMDILEGASEGDPPYSFPKDIDERTGEMIQIERDRSRNAFELTATEEDENEILSQVVLPGMLDYKEALRADAKSSKTIEREDFPRDFAEASLAGRRSPENHHHGNPAKSTVSASPSSLADLPLPGGDWTNHSLPDDLSTGTDLYAANGGFVNIRRGGYSNEGSFNNRLLSPSSLPDFDAPELRSPSPTRRLSKRSSMPDDVADHPRSAPVTPRRKQHAKSKSANEFHSSGSPLKLFDKYDTFTNDRLIRRISKYEESIPESEEEQSRSGGNDKASNAAGISRSSSQNSYREAEETQAPPSGRRISSFGEGQLDDFPFHANHALKSQSQSGMGNKTRPGSTPQDDIFRSKVTVESRGIEDVEIQLDATQTVNGKRLPNSPNKESQAKRRRTLRDSEELDLENHQYAVPAKISNPSPAKTDQDKKTRSQVADPAPLASTSVAGKKRKDAKYNNDNQIADPKILALRQILRPRTPTPSQRGSQKPSREQTDAGLLNAQVPDYADDTPVMDLEHQTQALAGELANFTLNLAQDMTQGGRKASLTTADFFNEAKQIMQLIRNEARPQSSHDILEEAEEDESEVLKPLVDESTIDEFSRPPSREGGSLRRLREPAQVDARVVSHLRKFEDTDDLGLALPSSVNMMHIKESLEPSVSPDKIGEGCVQPEALDIQSNPPNIRIRVQAERQVQEEDVISRGEAATTSTGAQSYRSQSSSGPSSGRSVPTGSSRGSRSSGTKAVIAPQVISHLLSDNVGGMTFDHHKQVWVKRKDSGGSQGLATHSRSGSDITENLFEDIPDLSVDEFQEQQRTQRIIASVKVFGSASDSISNHDHVQRQPIDDQSSRPQTRDSAMTASADQSSVPSKFSHFASSGSVLETRATSWGDEIMARKSIHVHVQSSNDNPTPGNQGHSEEVEHEISILEGRTSQTPRHSRHGQRQPRVVTVAFSSPLTNHVQRVNDENNFSDAWDDGSDLDLADSPVREEPRSASARKRRTPSGLRTRSIYRSGSRRASIGLARPMSRVDENEELTFLQSFHGPQNTSMNVVVTTPLASSRSMLHASALSSAQASSVGFQLSPLSEFTVHNNDELVNRDINGVTKHRGLLSSHEVEGKLSLTVQELVKKLTDIEPYEPYWDCIRQVDLRNRNLRTLHMLDEFCGHIEDLDVSDNELGQLHGAPPWIRQLNARGNYLSNITSWSHLQNLQYLDVSDNQISNLVGFQSLVHLRELRANDNQVESLEGILGLDGLIKIALRGNCIKMVNLEACNLTRLTDLDLSNNGIGEVNHLNLLPALKRLDLSENDLEALDFVEVSRSLQDLRLANNRLRALDIGQLPSLQSLDIDNNAVACIGSITDHTSLEILSWREQRLEFGCSETSVQYQQCLNVRELYLSGNTMGSFAPSDHMFDLRHLELASTGLQSLSDDFGIKCSNLRVLNLNFNALTELRPLLGLVKLETLRLAGNRVSRLRRTASVLDRIGHELTEIDLRQNPFTLGFYVPQQRSRPTIEQQLTVPSRIPSANVADAGASNKMQNNTIYMLPWVEENGDDAARQRLDEDTKMRRRVYEMLVALRCKNLRRLDGLCLDRRKVVAKDGIWDRLRELGVLTDKERNNAVELDG